MAAALACCCAAAHTTEHSNTAYMHRAANQPPLYCECVYLSLNTRRCSCCVFALVSLSLTT